MNDANSVETADMASMCLDTFTSGHGRPIDSLVVLLANCMQTAYLSLDNTIINSIKGRQHHRNMTLFIEYFNRTNPFPRSIGRV